MRIRVGLAAVFMLLALGAACGGGTAAGPSRGLSLEAERPHLTVPPSAGTAVSLQRLADAAQHGDAGAAWARSHELIDLFDAARAAHDVASRALVLQALAVPDAGDADRGRTTDAALDALLVGVDHVLELDRLHKDAQAARTLLDWDRHPPASRKDLYVAAAALKRIARGGGPLAANATLRLALFCAGAFRDAPRLVARDRPGALSSCLYSLFDADPAPYFDADPARRPPAPAWKDLDAGLGTLLDRLAKMPSRVAGVAAPLRAEQATVVADAEGKGLLPRPLDPRALRLPMVAAAPVFDWEPLVFVHDPTPEELARFEKELGELLVADGRSRAALALTADAPASSFLAVAGLARRLGADTVELAVGWEQQVKPPSGDYWFGRTPDGRVARVGVLGLAFVGGAGWDPARSALGMTLVVGPKRWQLVAPRGALPPVEIGADAAAASTALGKELAQIADAFPDEAALAVVPEPDVTVGALAAALVAARAHKLALGLGEAAPTPARGGNLAARAALRAGAHVKIVPDAFADRVPAVRRCYQDAVEHDASLAGVLAIEAGPRVVSGPRDETLRRCVVARLADKMAAEKTPSVRVELSK